MKKILSLLVLLLLVAKFTFADKVDKTLAQQIAENFYSAQVDSKVSFSVDNISTFEFEGETTLYIISFKPTGFVIVSADDVARPIIGYSKTNEFKDGLSNSNVTYSFECYSKQINQAKLKKTQDSKVKAEWDNLKSNNFSKLTLTADPLLTTTWNQSPYYNLLCPTGTPSGCVATAMSQIMFFHKWPVKGQGWHKYIPSAHPNYGIQYADFSSTSYDWLTMPVDLSASNSTTEKNAVATLMYHAGVAVDMNYAIEGSGAMSQDVMYALTSYFKYDPSTIRYDTLNINDQTSWLNLIKNEIDNSRPVYYAGTSGTTDGHAWVCDGYDSYNNLHMNWGWGGYANGYYTVTALSPTGTTYEFSKDNSVITGIKPNQNITDVQWVKQSSAFTARYRGIQNISAVNDRVAWAVAYDGDPTHTTPAKVKDFTRTIDGGSTWVSGTINAASTTNFSAAMISAVSDKKAWVALFGPSGGGKIVATIDGGVNWTTQSTATFASPAGFPNVVYLWDENNGFCMGDPNGGYFEIYTTTNGGTTWTRVSSSKIPGNSDGEYGTVGFYSVYGNTVWFATNLGRIYKSTDKGYNWVAYQTPITDASFEVSFKDDNIGIIQSRGTGTKLSYITTNGGQTWSLLTSTGTFYQSSFMFIPGSNLLVSTGINYSNRSLMGVSYSTDNGATFTDYASFYKNFPFLALGATSSKSIWAGGFNSDKYSDGMWHYGSILASADFSVNNTLADQNDSTVIFTDNSFGSPESWSWNFGDGASPQTITGVGPHEIKYTSIGSKTVTLTISKGTDQQIYVKENYVSVTWPVGVETTNMDQKYSVYPNPASTVIKIDGYKNGSVKVFSSTGALVMDVESLSADGSLNISKLSGGMYIIRIQTPDGKSESKKLTIIK